MLHSLALSLLVLAAPPPVVAMEMVATPFGLRPASCVLEVRSGSTVDEDDSALLVHHPAQATTRHKPPAECSESWGFPHTRPGHAHRALRAMPPLPLSVANNQTCDSPPCTCDTLPCNNWIDNAGSMDTSRIIGGMSSTYSVPGTPPKGDTPGQVLFYFIGAENTNGYPRTGQPPPSGRAILQPVLTYDPSGWCKRSKTGWCFSSWCVWIRVKERPPHAFQPRSNLPRWNSSTNACS
jgi:hypothetical protein